MALINLVSLHAADGTKIRKTPTSSYPNIYRFNSTEIPVENLDDFHKALQNVAHSGGCILKGNINRPLNNQSRAKSTDPEAPTNWVCLDLDGADFKSPEAFIEQMPPAFHDTSYVLQYSSSHGIKPGLRCHLFFLLTHEMSPIVVKQLLIQWNFKVPSLNSGLNLTSSNMALTYPLDITVCQNDKLIYVTPMEGKRVSKNTFQLIKKKRNTIDLSNIFVSPEQNKLDQKQIINDLRKAKGMAVRKQINTKQMGQMEVMSSPDEALVTGTREDGDFVYLNLNGGDSWAYYHLKNKPEFIHNFKGEPSYRSSELVPSYYKRVRIEDASVNSGREYFAVLDKRTTTYVVGFYEKDSNEVTIDVETRSVTHVNHYMLEHGHSEPSFIPTWDVVHDFKSDVVFDPKKKIINKYKPSDYMKNAVEGEMHPKIRLLIDHVFNYDADTIEHYLNWIAVILQTKKQTGAAWVMHGTQGTGKGILFKLLTSIIGSKYTTTIMLHDIERDYNGFIDSSLLIAIDEAQMSAVRNVESVVEKLKHFIADSPIRVNEKNKRECDLINNCNFMMFSNQYDPMNVNMQDRRFNIAPRQEHKLLDVIKLNEIDEMYDHIQSLANYLMTREIDVYKASTIIDTDARQQLQDTTRTSNEQVADALRTGNFWFFLENMPDAEFFSGEITKANMLADAGAALPTYKQILTRMYKSVTNEEELVLDRYDLAVLFYGVSGAYSTTKNKFGRFMNTMHLPLIPTRTSVGIVRALAGIQFSADDEAKAMYKKLVIDDKPKRIK